MHTRISALDLNTIGEGKLGKKIVSKANIEFLNLGGQPSSRVNPGSENPIVNELITIYKGSHDLSTTGLDATNFRKLVQDLKVDMVEAPPPMVALNHDAHPKVERISNLPNMARIVTNQREGRMRIANVSITSDMWGTVTTRMDTENKDTLELWPLQARICEIDGEGIQGAIPSKIFAHGWDEFTLVYYINDSLPPAVRPFKGKTYMMWAYLCKHESLLYNTQATLFIDQINTDHGLIYVFIFDETNHNLLVMGEK
jgi:hypothetical protein